MIPSIQATTAQFPGYTFEQACERIAEGVTEGFGKVHMEHVQLCPQASDFVDEICIQKLQKKYPKTKSRTTSRKLPGKNRRTRQTKRANSPEGNTDQYRKAALRVSCES